MKGTDLDIDLDPEFDEKMFKIERIGWGLMILLLVAAASGVFGQSKFSWRKASAGELTAHYSRFIRKEAPTEIKFEVENASERQVVWISQDYIEKFKVEAVNPNPDEIVTRDSGVEYQFKTRGGHFQVNVEMVPQDFGSISGKFSSGSGQPETSIQQFSYF